MQLHEMTIYFSSKIPKDTHFYMENMLKIVNKAKKKKKYISKHSKILDRADFDGSVWFLGRADFDEYVSETAIL